MSLYLMRIGLWGIAIVLLFVAAGTDLRRRIIPNRLVALVAANGLLLGLLSRPERIWISLLAALAVLFGCGLFSHFRLLGGGDVKLIGAATLLVPPERIGVLLLAISLVGGLLSGGYLAAYYVFSRPRAGKLKSVATKFGCRKFAHLIRSERARVLSATSVPYGVAVLGGVALVTVCEAVRCFSATSCSL